MGSAIAKDVPPYLMVSGNPAHPHGMNVEGLKRRGFSKETLTLLRKAYKVLYRSGLTFEKAKIEIKAMAVGTPELELFSDFLESSQRSIVR